MAGSVNKVIILGNLCADPEIKAFANGGRIANCRLATNETWKDRATGERKERVEYHTVVVQGDGLVGVVERFLKKGSKVYLEGKIQTRKWQDRDGQDRYSTEIVVGMGGQLTMLDGAKGQTGSDIRSDLGREPRGAQGGGGMGSAFPDDLDDDIPFASCDPVLEYRAR